MAPKKGMQKSLPCLIVSLRHCIPPIGKQGKEMLGAKKGVAFLHGNGTHSRVSFYFRPFFFVRVVVHKLYTINQTQTDLEAVAREVVKKI